MTAYSSPDWPASPPLSALVNGVHHTSAEDLLALLPDASVDAIITDPPYGMGLDEWDKPIDIPAFLDTSYRVLRPNSFLAFTIQMPYMADWLVALRDTEFKFKEHITWLKRNTGATPAGLSRTHENILLYTKGSAAFVETKGRYTDIKVPGLMFDAITIGAIQRYIDELWAYAQTGQKRPANGGRRHAVFTRRGGFEGSRMPEYTNFTNVWSFLPEHYQPGDHTLTIGHASVKPLKMFERLVELLTPAGALVVDPFSGSGTTALACRNTNRRYIVGDLSAEYCDLMRRRLAQPYTVPMFAA